MLSSRVPDLQRAGEQVGRRVMATSLAGVPVLIVEDEPAISVLLESAVHQSGALVVGPADRVRDALATIAREHVALAILDLIVHDEYCDAVAQELIRRRIPFALTTGLGTDFNHPHLQAAPTITKPFQARYVQIVLTSLLERTQAEYRH
jgi:DNA-binding response OmpR family regulator